MSEAKRLSERNAAITELMSDGSKLKDFYRFAAQNPHIELHDACQIVIARSNASICFAFEEWNAMGRRIKRGSKGIPYYDRDGNKLFAFDSNDTYGDMRYQREFIPMKRLLVGLDILNDTNLSDGERGDYRKIHMGVGEYLKETGVLGGDIIRNRLLIEGITYSLYCKTGFPKDGAIELSGLPYPLMENAKIFKEITALSDNLAQEAEEGYQRKKQEVKVVNDTDEETVTDELVLNSEQNGNISLMNGETEKPKQTVTTFYEIYLSSQRKYQQAVVLIKIGDFYEVMGENAVTVSNELDLILIGRDVGLAERVPMCGFPYHVTDKYVEKILEKHSVLMVEDGEEPKYILSHAEATKKSAEPNLNEINDYIKGAEDSLFPDIQNIISNEDEQSDEISEQEIEEEDIDDEADELVEFEEDFDEDDYADIAETSEELEEKEQEKQPQEKQKGKPLSQRKRKAKPQPMLWNYNLAEEQTPEEQVKEWGLKRGSGFESGKFRIYDEYKSDPTVNEFADFLKKEYGWGGVLQEFVNVDHDAGFIWHISSVVNYNLTKDERSRISALKAASFLASRFNPRAIYKGVERRMGKGTCYNRLSDELAAAILGKRADRGFKIL